MNENSKKMNIFFCFNITFLSEGPDEIWKFLIDKDNINKFICTAGIF